tara:strand:+ start:535 stop:915 length:381 start_codon:yes stop_codon:yes gene_type:complete
MELPKVNILTAGTFCVAILSAAGGSIWYASNQASIIEALQSEVEILNIQNNQADKTNLIRDVEQNTENIEEMLDILVEMQEEYEDADSELWDEVDNMINYFTQLVQLQSRVAILENTVEFTRRDGM